MTWDSEQEDRQRPERGSGPLTPLALCSQWRWDVLAAFLKKGSFSGRKAILGLPLPGCALGLSGLPAGQRGGGCPGGLGQEGVEGRRERRAAGQWRGGGGGVEGWKDVRRER